MLSPQQPSSEHWAVIQKIHPFRIELGKFVSTGMNFWVSFLRGGIQLVLMDELK